MKVRNKLHFLTVIFAIAIALSACNANEGNTSTVIIPTPVPIEAEEQPATEETEEDILKPAVEPQEESPKETASQPIQTIDPSELPTNKDLEFLLEGMTEKVSSTLTLSDQGYGLYLMDSFDFAMEGPGKDIIFSKNRPDYFARIELLPAADVNVDEVKVFMKDQLSVTGNIIELSKEETNQLLGESVSYFIQSNNEEISRSSMLLNGGNSYLLVSLFIPNGEAMEGLSQRLYTMINTLVVTQ